MVLSSKTSVRPMTASGHTAKERMPWPANQLTQPSKCGGSLLVNDKRKQEEYDEKCVPVPTSKEQNENKKHVKPQDGVANRGGRVLLLLLLRL